MAMSLVELLVVIAIIGILAALLLPGLSRSKQQAQGTYCVNNLKTNAGVSDAFAQVLVPNVGDSPAKSTADKPLLGRGRRQFVAG